MLTVVFLLPELSQHLLQLTVTAIRGQKDYEFLPEFLDILADFSLLHLARYSPLNLLDIRYYSVLVYDVIAS